METGSDSDEYDLNQAPLFQHQASQPPISPSFCDNSQIAVLPLCPQTPRYSKAWVEELHEKIQAEIERDGIKACTWERLLERWREHICEVPYEQVEVGCAKQILQHARLTSAASPMFYETLRRYAFVYMPTNVFPMLIHVLV
jgi:hypothetical protein